MGSFAPSNELQGKITDFNQADVAYKAALDDFMQKAAPWFALLDPLREVRNRRLDDVQQELRRAALTVKYDELVTFTVGQFKVSKKMEREFVAEPTIQRLKDLGLYDTVKSRGLVVETESIQRDELKKWLEENEHWLQFKDLWREEEITPAVSGPKEVPPFGAELKKKL